MLWSSQEHNLFYQINIFIKLLQTIHDLLLKISYNLVEVWTTIFWGLLKTKRRFSGLPEEYNVMIFRQMIIYSSDHKIYTVGSQKKIFFYHNYFSFFITDTFGLFIKTNSTIKLVWTKNAYKKMRKTSIHHKNTSGVIYTSFSHWGEKKLHRRCFSAYFL